MAADNTITYILSLQDKISGKLKSITITNERQLSTWAKVQQKVNESSGTMKDMGRTIGSLNERINALKAQREWIPTKNINAIKVTNREIQLLEKEIQKLNNLDGGLLKRWFLDIKNSIPGFVNPLSAAVAGIGKSISIGMDDELQRQNITTLMGGDKVASDALFNKISEYGKATVYDKSGLIESQKTMMSFGLSSEFAFEKLKQIGDIAMGDKQKMDSLSLAFSQATSTGKLMGQDLLQMINAGFNPLNVISKKTGESIESLKDRMSEGKISADELSMAFQWATEEGGLFYKGAEKAGETIAGKWNSMKDTLSEMAITIFDVIEPVIRPIIEVATKVFNAISEGIANWKEKLEECSPIVTAVTGVIFGIVSGLLAYKIVVGAVSAVTKVWAGVQAILNLVLSINPLGLIIAAIVGLIAVIVFLCLKVKGWGTLWDAVVTFAKETFYAFVEGVKLYFTTLVNSIMMGIDKIKLGWYKFKEAVGIGDSAENQKIIAQINNDVEVRKKEITDGAKKVAEHAKNASKAFEGVNLTLDKSVTFKSLTDKLKTQLGITDQSTKTTINNDLSTTSETISAGGKNVKNFNITINDGLVNGVKNYFNSSSDNPDTASDFMWRLSNALQLILNDVNYAAE